MKAPWELSVVSGYEETYAEQQEKAMFLQKIGSALEKEKYEEAVEDTTEQTEESTEVSTEENA